MLRRLLVRNAFLFCAAVSLGWTQFLNALRRVGTSEGIFRYAAPGSNGDQLATILRTITDSVLSCASVSVTMTSPFPARSTGAPISAPVSGASSDAHRSALWLCMVCAMLRRQISVVVAVVFGNAAGFTVCKCCCYTRCYCRCRCVRLG